MSSKVLLVGAGPMAIEYAKVLTAQRVVFDVIGRGPASAAAFAEQAAVPVRPGGVEGALRDGSVRAKDYTGAIVAVGEARLGATSRVLLEAGFESVLVEKPGGLDGDDIRSLAALSVRTDSEVFVAYNRRFFASTQTARQLIAEDGGVTSFGFEFTEWGHVIRELSKEPGVLENWFLQNSSHVLDLAFFLGGQPREFASYVTGSLDWHPSGSVYAGAGRSTNGALFTYQANWAAPGRWALEFLTAARRFVFKPMEKLQVQRLGSVAVEEYPIDDGLDRRFKPGVYAEVESFLGSKSDLPSIEEQVRMLEVYESMRRTGVHG